MTDILITLVGTFVLLLLLIAIPLASGFFSLHAYLARRYLNRYFLIKMHGSGVYELHHHPALWFYYARPRKFYRLLQEAVWKFHSEYPDMKLVAVTFLQSKRLGGISVPIEGCRLPFAHFLAVLGILTNFSNYRLVNGKQYFITLIRDNRRLIPKEYDLTGWWRE